jgi:hypothetical protein
MKSYKQFVSETYTAQERLDEFVVPILRGVGRLAATAGKTAFLKRGVRGVLGGIGAGRALSDKDMSGKDKAFAMATGAASAIPVVGTTAMGLHLGDYLRSKKFGKDSQWLKKTLGLTDEKESK